MAVQQFSPILRTIAIGLKGFRSPQTLDIPIFRHLTFNSYISEIGEVGPTTKLYSARFVRPCRVSVRYETACACGTMLLPMLGGGSSESAPVVSCPVGRALVFALC